MAESAVSETFSQWLVKFNDIKPLWSNMPTYLISQAVYTFAGLLTLLHAFRKGGRWPYFWVATILHGLFTDNFWAIVLPEYDNFWHSQTPIMLLGGRLPIHIILLYPAFIYHAAYAVSKLNLPKYAQPFAVGLVTVLVDIPYDIVAVKFVHWIWHDTDPNIFDRHYWVPWNSYYFHAAFAASFFFFFNAARSWYAPTAAQWDSSRKSVEWKALIISSLLDRHYWVPWNSYYLHAAFAASFFFFFNEARSWYAPTAAQWDSSRKSVEWKALIISSLLGMPGGVLLFVLIYHSLHDMYKIHSEVTFCMLFVIFFVIVLFGILSEREKTTTKLTLIDYVLLLQLALHYLIYLAFVIFFDPTTHVSTGLHEPVGPCHEVATLVTPFGQELEKRKYFCPSNYDEKYFDFHCVGNKLPPNGTTWYTICGTPFENRVEYITVLSMILILAFGVFYSLYFKTYSADSVTTSKKSN